MLFRFGPKSEEAEGAAGARKSYLYRLLFRLQLGAMAEDLQLPSELLDDGFFHGFLVEREEKRMYEREETGDHSSLDDDDKILHLKQQQLLQQQLWAERQSKAKGGSHSPGVSSSGRTPFLVQLNQPLPGSGMTAVFLCSSGARKESTGTGVFLPRTARSKPRPQRKSGNPDAEHQPTSLPGVRPLLSMSS